MSNYVRHLLMTLLRLDHTNEYVILLHRAFYDDLAKALLLGQPNIHPIVTAIPFMGPGQQLQVPWLVRRLPQVAVYHYPHFDMPYLAHPRSVVTVFDLNQFSLPGYFDSLRHLKRLYSFGATSLSVAKSRHIITISHATRAQLLKHFPRLDPDKVTVIYFGLNDAFRDAPDPERLARFRQKFGLGHDRFILYVGTDRPHKNLDRLLLAYARLRRHLAFPHKLLLVGVARHDERIRRLVTAAGLNGSVLHLGYVEEAELPLAYRAAEVLAFCSLSEGFGMPLLEAMASDVPIVTSQTGAMAEITGESAVLVDPFSVESIAEGLSMVLASEALRRKLAAQGRERMTQFTWEEAAQKTIEVYTMVGRPDRSPSLCRDERVS